MAASPAPPRTGPRRTTGSSATSSVNRRAPSRMPAAFAVSLAPAAVSLFRCFSRWEDQRSGARRRMYLDTVYRM